MGVARATLSKNSQLHSFFQNGDFLDCYSVDIGHGNVPITDLAQRIFLDQPGWANALLAIRDLGVTPFGLKTTANLPTNLDYRSEIHVGDHINFLCVLGIDSNEIILGEDDLHLDFRISVYRENAMSGRISLATWVHTHNRFGKIYLATITPFHILIVKSALKKLARRFAT